MKYQTTRMKINTAIINELVEAQHKITSLIDIESGCSVSCESKNEISLYVRTYILPKMKNAISAICQDHDGNINCYSNLEYYHHTKNGEIELIDPAKVAYKKH